MFVALDYNDNRVYADDAKCTEKYRCPVCGELVTCKLGKGRRRPHFAHMPDSNCPYNLDKDRMSEWHIRMQNYFPKETREYRFKDQETGEIHIADIYIEGKKTVLEFQHSKISEEEFLSRTIFHLKNGRKIVWLFDESSSSEDSKAYGRFREDDLSWEQWPYRDKCFKWLRNPRYVLSKGPQINFGAQYKDYSVCIYTGTEGDIFHRIVNENDGFGYVTFSVHNIKMNDDMDTEEFFLGESFWLSQEPWKSRIAEIQAQKKHAEEERRKAVNQALTRKINSMRRRRGRRF